MARGFYVTQPLHRAVQQFADRPALRCGPRSTTFGEMYDRVGRLAGGLRSLGMQAGDRVAILALNSDRYFEYMIAVPWGGGVINPCNTRWSAQEILFSLIDSASTILLADDHFLAMARDLANQCPTLRVIVHLGEDSPDGLLSYEALIAGSAPVADAGRSGDDLFGLFYTGGTTGKPKGVMLSHDNFLASSMALSAANALADDGVFLHAAPMFHLADLGIASAAWLKGYGHSFVPRFSPPEVIETIARDQVTTTLLVPTMIQMLVDHPMIADRPDLQSLRTIVYGASPMPEAVLERAFAVFPNVDFTQAYGMTELSPIATILGPYYHRPEARGLGKLRSAGRASQCTEVHIVDAAGETLPAGEAGEIIVRGANVMQGYWNQPELTSAAIRDGWMHTGDAGYLDADGFLFVIDRVKDMIISGGENIYSAEVENALCQHPAVQAAAVIGIPSEQWGETVHGFVIFHSGRQASTEELVLHCRQLIAGYKCPRSLEVVAEFPLSGAGKVLKTDLRARFWDPQDRQIA